MGRLGNRSIFRVWALLFTVLASSLVSYSVARAEAPAPAVKGGYKKSSISDARYGTEERERLLKIAYSLSANLNKVIFGQEAATAVMQAKLIQYLEGFPNRTGEPVMMNMIGLPGIGKSAMLEFLKKAGLPLVEFDAQKYATTESDSFERDLYIALLQKGAPGASAQEKPLIVTVEELDKVGERSPTGNFAEKTSKIIGLMNMISSEGKVSIYGGANTVPVSNVMFITTMNISPTEFEVFSKEILGIEKSYYDYTIEDFAKFDEWIRTQSSARYKVLSRMFRSNTVGRFGVNTTIMKPLASDSYKKIIDLQVARAIRQNTQEKNLAKRVTVDVHESMAEFLLKEAVYAPSGARETVALSNALIEQLIGYGIKATGEGVTRVDRPRHIDILYYPESNRVVVRVTEMILKKNSKTELVPAGAIAFEAKYDPGARLFLPPDGISSVKPSYPKPSVTAAEKPVTQKEVFESRFPKSKESLKGMREELAKYLFGQTEAINTMVTDFENYFGRQGPSKKEPSSRAYAGFPGIGKSELFFRSAKILDLPVVRLNMQQYASDSELTVSAFMDMLQNKVMMAESKRPDGKYLLLFEELDKIFELSPQGEFVNRPVMAVIKDILNDGVLKAEHHEIDIRGAFVGITMNFAVDRFGFQADPRMTSIDDVIRAWKRLKMNPASIKKVLGSMFLPDTVSRLMTQLTIMKPLDRPAYTKIIDTQAEAVTTSRLLDEDKRNVGQILIKTTPSYKRYVFSESVIPSEGARNTTKHSNAMISTDLEYALARLPRSSKYAKAPLTITLDYSEARQVVRFKVQRTDTPAEKPLLLEDRTVSLNFPSTSLKGRISEERMHVTAHEFGHAFTGVRLGARFEHVVVVPPSPGTGGYVRPNGVGDSAADNIARIYMILGSRAFERIIFSPNPMDPESVLRVSSGPSQDIQQATMTLYDMLYELGMNPNGGTVDRNFMTPMGKYAAFREMPSELAEKFGMILRDIEDEIVRETLAEHSMDWYVEKIASLAREGSMTEKQFYELIGRKLPAADRRSVGVINDHFRSLFGKYLEKPTGVERKAASAKSGDQKMTPADQTERAIATFSRVVRDRLGPANKAAAVVRTCSDIFVATH